MDLSQLTTEDLLALRNKQYDKLSTQGLMYLHTQKQGSSTPTPSAQPQNTEANSTTPSTSPNARPPMTRKEQYDFDTIPDNVPDIRDTAKQMPEALPMAAGAMTAGTGFAIPAAATAGASLLKQKLEGKPLSFGETAKDTVLNAVIPSVVEDLQAPAEESKLRSFLKPAADRSEVLSKVKGVKDLEPYVKGKIDAATQAYNSSEITPRMDAQYAKSAEQWVPWNPEQFKNVTPEADAEVTRLSSLYDKEIPMSEALKLRAAVNSGTRFTTPGPYASTTAAPSNNYDAGNALRENIRQVDPEVGQLSDELKDAYGLRKAAVGNAGRDPVKTVLSNDSPAGLTKRGRLMQFDDKAGSDLTQLGDNIKTANDRLKVFTLGGLKKLAHPLEFVREGLDMATTPVARSYDAAAQGLYNMPSPPAGSEMASPLYYLLRSNPEEQK